MRWCRLTASALIPAKDLVESVMKRVGATDYTILAAVQGSELELMRFKHPFLDFDVPAILGDHVTLDAGTGAVHTAGGHGPDDYTISQKYGLEIANPVGPDGAYLPVHGRPRTALMFSKPMTSSLRCCVSVARCYTLRNCSTAIHAAGATSRRSSSAPLRSGS
ncbi:class I tRNA ligase family protein [Klebsiella pneumoniae]|nr:class I tRNA ligase family protein [Klebsiella pneumoniae]